MMPVVSRRTAKRRALTFTYEIYVLVDRDDGTPRYIGRARNAKRRCSTRFSQGWTRALLAWAECGDPRRARLHVVEEPIGAAASIRREEFWIAEGRRLGWPLINKGSARGGCLALGRKPGGGEWTLRDLGLEAA